jgi:hypothetical protein
VEVGLWRAYRNVTVAAQELMPMLLVHVGAPTFYFRFLDRLSNALLESMHLAATYACRRAWELLGEGGVGGDDLLHGLHAHGGEDRTREGPMRSVLRVREEHRKRLLEGAAASLKGSSLSGEYCSTPNETAPPGKAEAS